MGGPSLNVAIRERNLSLAVDLSKLQLLSSNCPRHEHTNMRAFGGSILLRVGNDVVRTLTMSGEPDELDHESAEQALRRFHSA